MSLATHIYPKDSTSNTNTVITHTVITHTVITCKRCEGRGYTQEVIFLHNETEKFICVSCNGRGLLEVNKL
jgi:DnaJ-class molecular chaperone